jgi:hypothetical protein
MQLDKHLVLEGLKNSGKNEHVQHAIREVRDKIDHDRCAALLEKFGLDPG